MELELVKLDEDRFQILDSRGRIVTGYASELEARAFVAGYVLGKTDTADRVRSAVDAAIAPRPIANGAKVG